MVPCSLLFRTYIHATSIMPYQEIPVIMVPLSYNNKVVLEFHSTGLLSNWTEFFFTFCRISSVCENYMMEFMSFWLNPKDMQNVHIRWCVIC